MEQFLIALFFFHFESAEQHPTLHLLDISSTYFTYLLGFKVFQLRAIILHSHHLS